MDCCPTSAGSSAAARPSSLATSPAATPAPPHTTAPPPARLHLGLGVRDVERSSAFYEAFFGQPPGKRRPGYARFVLDEPSLVLSLIAAPEAAAPRAPTHFGVRVASAASVRAAAERLAQHGLATSSQHEVTCCHATQDKVWVSDPDGHAWEVYTVLDDAPAANAPDASCCPDSACCGSAPCP